MFNGLVERCFCECVVSFRSKALTATEEKCVSTCAEKYMKHSVRQCPVRRACSHAAPSCPHAAPRRDGWVSALANSRWRSSKHRRRQPPEQDNSGLYTCARSIAVCAVCVPSRTPALGRAPAARVASVVLHSSVGWLFSFCSHAGKSRPSLSREQREQEQARCPTKRATRPAPPPRSGWVPRGLVRLAYASGAGGGGGGAGAGLSSSRSIISSSLPGTAWSSTRKVRSCGGPGRRHGGQRHGAQPPPSAP